MFKVTQTYGQLVDVTTLAKHHHTWESNEVYRCLNM